MALSDYGFSTKEQQINGNCKEFTIDGYSSRQLKAFCTGAERISKARRRYDRQHIPGRSGDLIYTAGDFDNVKIKYTFTATEGAAYKLNNWINKLLTYPGYHRIECGIDNGHFRSGFISEVLDPLLAGETGWEDGTVDVIFECKPQRWETSGEYWTALTDGNRVPNYSMFECAPLYRLRGAGKVQVGASSLTIDSDITSDGIYFDSELGDAYYYRYGVIQPYNRHATLVGDMHAGAHSASLVQITGEITVEAQLRTYEV